MSTRGHSSFWRVTFLLTFILTALAFWEILAFVLSRPIALFASQWTVLLAFFMILALLAATLLGLSFHKDRWERIESILDGAGPAGKKMRVLFLCIFAAILPVYTLLTILLAVPLADIQDPFFATLARGWQLVTYLPTGWPGLGIRPLSPPNLCLRLWAFWTLGSLAALVIRRGRREVHPGKALALSMLLQAAFYVLASFATEVSTLPFSVHGWSETSRYYYASLLFSEKLYGFSIPLSVWHPTRYFLQSLPFLLPGLPLVAHRIWQVSLWIGMTLLTSTTLMRRLQIRDAWLRWIFAAWASLFLLQAGVYYHLLICILLVLAGFSLSHPKRTWVFILLASFWAGMSRLNWFPVPGMLAGLLYFLERPYQPGKDRLWSYFKLPFLWGALGTLTAFLAQALYVRISGNSDVRAFGSSLTSDLLWYRLLPNPTYSPGILLAVILATLPALLLMAGAMKTQKRPCGWSLAALVVYLLVLLFGGLVVSVKIGGGGDLHNMDAFLVFVLVGAGVTLAGQLSGGSDPAPQRHASWRLAALAVLIPILFAVVPVITFQQLDRARVANQLALVREEVQRAASQGEVLFISQRQLVTFGTTPVVLSPDYELLFLMEMALSGNTPYLESFSADMRAGRFSLIIAPEQKLIHKGPAYSFGEENDAWTENIAHPILCYYEPVQTFQDLDVQLLVPRQEPAPDCVP